MSFIKTEILDNTGVITINRPNVYNALNRDAKLEIISAIKNFNKDKMIKAIILTGEGKAFCSGQDLTDPYLKNINDIGITLIEEWNPLIEAITLSEKIIIAAINGVCAGAGLSMALACDLKIAPPQNKFISGFAQIGLTPDAGLDYFLVKNLGYSKSLEFSLFGKPLYSEDFFNAGIINEIQLDSLKRAQEMAKDISTLAPLSVKTIKKNLKFAETNSLNDVVQRETYTQRYLGHSQDYKEGVLAFSEKRKPNFQGI
jgi:2-(1,2-epoxy-1,2-dihydrophenyl)acetyl-CoA isomerase